MIYPAAFTAATTTTQTRTIACSPKTEWPKVIGDTTTYSYFWGIDTDSSNGNIIVGGTSAATNVRTVNYGSASYTQIFIHLLNNLGDL